MAICGKCHREAPDGALFCSFCGATIKPSTAEGEAVDPLIGQTISGKYFVHQLLGRGGMGEVYKATHMTLDRPVVLKLLKKSFLSDPSIVQRFHREARAASRLNHPNSITIIDFGQTEDGTLFMAMEYLSGRSLSRVIAEDQPIAETRVVHIGAQILAALAEAHALGIIHRDLKPENVMLESRRDEPDFVKVLDFGIAKLNEPGDGAGRLTQAGIVCGTPGYMSPEQVRGDELDARSDLYSVGIILYEMLTGKLPFDAETPMGLVTKHLVEAPPALGVRKPGLHVSPGLEALVLRCLAKDRNERPATAEEMRAALLAWVAQGEHVTRPTPAPARTVLMDAAAALPHEPPRGETGSVKVWRPPTGSAAVTQSPTRGAAPPTPAPQSRTPAPQPRTPAPLHAPRTPPPTTVMPTPPPGGGGTVVMSPPVTPAPVGGGTVVMAPPPPTPAPVTRAPLPPPQTPAPVTRAPLRPTPPPTTLMPTPAPTRPQAAPTAPRPAQKTPAHGKQAPPAPRHEMDEEAEEAPPRAAPPAAKSKLPLVAGAGAGAVLILALVVWGLVRKPSEPVAEPPKAKPPVAAVQKSPAPAPAPVPIPPPPAGTQLQQPPPVAQAPAADREPVPEPAPRREEPAPRPAPKVADVTPAPKKATGKGVRAVRAEINSIPTPSASTGDGVLTVTATPWANVFLDGTEMGETPREMRLGAGTYRVRATHPAMGSREQAVTIQPGKKRVVNVTFAN